MAVNYFILLFILLTTVPARVSPLKVYTFGQNSKRSSVVEILNSSIHELDQFTICGRLLTSSFTTSSHVWQNILFKVLKIRIIFMNSCQNMGLEVNFSQGFQKLRKIWCNFLYLTLSPSLCRWTCTFWQYWLPPPVTTSTRAARKTTKIKLVK